MGFILADGSDGPNSKCPSQTYKPDAVPLDRMLIERTVTLTPEINKKQQAELAYIHVPCRQDKCRRVCGAQDAGSGSTRERYGCL